MAGGVVDIIFAEKVKKDIIEVNSGLKEALATILEFNKQNRQDNTKNVNGPKDLTTQINKNKDAVTQLNKVVEESNRLNAKLTASEKALTDARSKTNIEIVKNRYETQILNKQTKEAAILSSKLSSEYSKLVVKMNQAGSSVQNLTAKKLQGIQLSNKEQQELKESQVQFLRYQKAVLGADASVGRFQRNVGNYPKALGAAANAARSLASALGLVGGAFLFVRVMRDAITVMKDYEKQNATLSAVLQIEKSQMGALREDSQRLGATTVKTANQVTELQVAFARLGFSQQEVLDLAEPTIQGSIAMNANLEETALLVGAVVRTYDDFSSMDAPKIIDVLSLATAKSALSFDKLQTAIPIVAGAANAAGIPFTKMVALLGKLSDSGIDASMSATALRNIFIISAAQGLSYDEILQKIKDSQDKLTASNDEFGRRAAVPAAVLSQNIDATKELDVALQGAAGTAKRMADKELDTLSGALELLKSAWQGVILGTDGANNISNKLKTTVKYLADNLEEIITFIGRTIKAWLIYKAIVLTVTGITKAYTGAVALLGLAKAALAGGIGKATVSMRAFNLASKANPIGILISLLAGAVALWVAFKDGADSAAGAQREFNKAVEDGKESAKKNIEVSNAATQKEIELINEKAREKRAGEKDERKLAEINKNRINETIDLLEKEKGTVNTRVVSYANQLAQYQKGSPEFAKFNALIEEEGLFYNELSARVRSLMIDKKELITVDEEGGKVVINYLKGSIGYLNEMIAANNALIDQATDRGTIEKLQKENELLEIQKNLLLHGAKAKQTLVDATSAGSNGSSVSTDLPGTILEGSKVTSSGFDLAMSDVEDFLVDYEDQIQAGIDLTNSFFDNKIQRIDDEIKANENKYAVLLAAAGDDQIQRDLLEAEFEKKKQALEKKRQKEARKQAIFNKALALSEITINTAIAVSKVAAQTGIFAAAGIGPILILGALQAATVLSQPIPKYKYGTSNHKGGAAIVGDGGVNEYTVSPGGEVGITPNTPTLVNLEKGTKVYPNFDKFKSETTDFTGMVYNASIMASLSIDQQNLSKYIESQKALDKQILRELQTGNQILKSKKMQANFKQSKTDFNHELFRLKNTNWNA